MLDGVFQDEHGDFPAGSYIRNPPQSSHTPGSDKGCVIFVKLWQFDLADRTQIRLDTTQAVKTAIRPSVTAATLFKDSREMVRIEEWEPNATIRYAPTDGLEILCLGGDFTESGEHFSAMSWLRLPIGAPLDAISGPNGARVWVKEGHLAHALTGLPQQAA